MTDQTHSDARPIYEITVQGIIDREWSDWFDCMTITHPGEDRTQLVGPVVDQAALYGLLCKIHNLGLVLISVRHTEDRP